MAYTNDSIWKSVDWMTICIYLMLVIFGWFSVCGASYDYGEIDFFSFDTRAGKQFVWICCSLGLGFILMMLEDKLYDMFAYILYGGMMLLLLITPFLAEDTKGSYSWIKFGPVSLQPAEFAKFATALALAKFMNVYGFTMSKLKYSLPVVGMVLLPMLLIILQRETGSALVYLAFFFMLYREGMPGSILFAGICAVVYFVVAVKYSSVLWGEIPAGEVLVFVLILLVVVGMLLFYQRNSRAARYLMLGYLAVGAVCGILMYFDVPVNLLYVCMGTTAAVVVYLVLLYFSTRSLRILTILATAVVSVIFLFSVDYAFNEVLESHQQKRIKVTLGMEEDLRGAGYNVNQSKIAIGSGGFLGKGFLNGTQTKLKYVPEQDTDFIFCTIGEEEGFWGAVGVIVLFVTLIFRLIAIGERQHSAFGRVYAYCVVSILFFHLAVNIGMVIGLCPVIGIPLPFFSYGGSSLWGFTILLFVLLRIDASRAERH